MAISYLLGVVSTVMLAAGVFFLWRILAKAADATVRSEPGGDIL
jgi:hypothetical protein